MKHFFIINPFAGPFDTTKEVKKRLESFEEWVEIDWETYVTKGPGDAAVYSAMLCERYPNETIRIYACGGDGTLNEVVTGIMGHTNAQVATFPSGSGNDYLRYYGARSDFRDLDRLIEGEPHAVDVMKVTIGRGPDAPVRYCVNVLNFAIESVVASTMTKVKRMPIIGRANAYKTGALVSVFTSRHNHFKCYVDGEFYFDGDTMLFCLSNGRYCGGGYMCAPLSRNDDGLIDIYRVLPLSLLRMPDAIAAYQKGEHVDNEKYRNEFSFRQGTDIELECPEPMPMAIDGELIESDYYHVEMIHNAFDFILPKGISPIK